MLQITEVNIFSLSKDEDVWNIEGEIIFEDDLISAFEADYVSEDDELEELSLELEFEDFDKRVLKEMILDAVNDYEE